jgi:hypothetical protein
MWTFFSWNCGEPAISLHLYTVPLVLWSTCLLPAVRDPGSIPRGYLSETGILLLALSRYIGGPDMIDHCGLIWGGLRPKPSLGPRADNVIIPLDLTQLFCPGFMLAEGPPSGFTTDIVGCWGGAPWRACNLTAFIHSSSGPVVHPFASCHEGPRFNPQGGVLMWNRDSPVSVVLLQNRSYDIIKSRILC